MKLRRWWIIRKFKQRMAKKFKEELEIRLAREAKEKFYMDLFNTDREREALSRPPVEEMAPPLQSPLQTQGNQTEGKRSK